MRFFWRKNLVLLALALAMGGTPVAALAHAPHFVREETVVEVKDPAVAQAFYGWLDGQAVLYKIKTDKPQKIHFQLLVPDVPNVVMDLEARFTAHTVQGLKKITLDGANSDWSRWHEVYGGEWYYRGPETSLEVATGTQTVFISNADLYGPYVLVVGDEEAFKPDEMIAALKMMPQLHAQFFLRPWYTAFFNRVGLFIAITIVILALMVWGMALAYRRSQHLLRRFILTSGGVVLLALDIAALVDLLKGGQFGLALDFAVLFASLAGYVGIVWVWKNDKSGIRHVMVLPSESPFGKED